MKNKITKEKKIDWEERLNKWWGCMFECGDYEALVDFVKSEKQTSFLEGQRELKGKIKKRISECKQPVGYSCEYCSALNDVLAMMS